MTVESLIERARRWLAEDPDPETRAELAELLAAAEGDSPGADEARAELAERFTGRLGFGTAGLRGELGAGPQRMNRVMVMQAAAGIARYLLTREAPKGEARQRERTVAAEPRPHVVIGYDQRKNSRIFAEDSARVLRGAGITVSLMPRMLPTPVLAFAVCALDATAGIMVTASHNPPRDNGYKVYLGGADCGSQLVSPADVEIARRIDEVAAAPLEDIPLGEGWQTVSESVIDEYVRRTAALTAPLGVAAGAPLAWVYTAMHGVGSETFQRVLADAGLPAPTVVPEQIEPDGNFPTVEFPNPEEPGALDLAYRVAATQHAELVLAHDPDADRLAVAVRIQDGTNRLYPRANAEVGSLNEPDARNAHRRGAREGAPEFGAAIPADRCRDASAEHRLGAPLPSAPGEPHYERLSGNELGALLGWEMAARAQGEGRDGTLAASLVSSPALGAVAEHYGLDYRETLSGFKWISRVPELIFGFEEALGYLVNPNDLRDKDGISAAVVFLSIAQRLRAEGRSLAWRREEFAHTFGVFANGQVSLRFRTRSDVADRMARLAADPPVEWAGIPVQSLDDFRHGVDGFPAADILRFRLADGSRIIARPSGTEPKLKVYLDAAAASAGTLAEKQAAAAARLAELEAAVKSRL